MSAKERPVSHPATDAYRDGHDRLWGKDGDLRKYAEELGQDLDLLTEQAAERIEEWMRHTGEPPCDHDAPRRGYYASKCSACGQDFLARDIR